MAWRFFFGLGEIAPALDFWSLLPAWYHCTSFVIAVTIRGHLGRKWGGWMAVEHVDTKGQVRVQAEVWHLTAGSQDPPPFFFFLSYYILTFLSADVEAWFPLCCFVVTARARAAPRVCKPSLQATTPEKDIAPTVGKGGVTSLQFICCTHIKGWNTCLFVLENFMCLKHFRKKPKPLSE